MRALKVQNLHKTYNGEQQTVEALKGVTFSVESGAFVALRGPSGCGKSTLLHLLGGMDRPSAGEVIVGDTRLDQLSDDQLAAFRRRKIGFVFQFFNLLPTLTVSENVKLPLLLDGADDSRSNKLAEELLQRVGLTERARHFPSALSGGEMQRAAVARALIARPALLLADEPTGNLDSENGAKVMGLLKELNQEMGVTILLATHSDEAISYAGRVIQMRDGMIESDLSVSQVVEPAGAEII